jgi:hypothetical protein
MKAYLTKVDEAKNYVVVTVYDSRKVKQYDLKVPKYFMQGSGNVDVGDEVTLKVRRAK